MADSSETRGQLTRMENSFRRILQIIVDLTSERNRLRVQNQRLRNDNQQLLQQIRYSTRSTQAQEYVDFDLDTGSEG